MNTLVLANRSNDYGVGAFRRRLLLALGLVVASLTACALYFAEHSVVAETRYDLQRAFAAELDQLRAMRDLRHAALVERCQAMVRDLQIQEALEQQDARMLYASARAELGDVLAAGAPAALRLSRPVFYRFLDADGRVIPFGTAAYAGALTPEEEAGIPRWNVQSEAQHGYFWRTPGEAEAGGMLEVIVTPIRSAETDEPMAALVAGFGYSVLSADRRNEAIRRGLWLDGRLHMDGLDASDQATLALQIPHVLASFGAAAHGVRIALSGAEHMLFCEPLNPGSLFPPAYEVGLYPVASLLARQRQLRWNVAGFGAALLVLGIGASFYISGKLAEPVRRLAAVSAENQILRERAEAALKVKEQELQRAARFSADASHQLKTPVAVMRAGLDALVSHEEISGDVREELAMLVHQTYRLTSVMDDLLLLSRLDSGRVQLVLVPVDLTQVVETCLDDLDLLNHGTDADRKPEIESSIAGELFILGERRFTMLIVQNLLENAWKYNRKHGRIVLRTEREGDAIVLVVGNTGYQIPPASVAHIFERFHRAGVGENVPGHGLGLNLARELARLHGGDVRLVSSAEDWTEFEVRFQAAPK